MVLKPSEEAPIDAVIWTEVMHAAGTPKGVYNMIQGSGAVVGEAMSSHPDIDMMSFTGSTRAGIRVAQAAATTVKRVAQELGGKSANILLPDVDFQTAVTKGINSMMVNSGQSCTAPTRMFVPQDRHDEVKAIAKAAAEKFVVGDPRNADTRLGPVVNATQYEKIQKLIQAGIAEGAELVTGGPGRPEHLNRGYYVRPTVFANVTNDMTIAREEIFGPVIAILPYKSEDEVIRLANDTIYGLAAYVQAKDVAHGPQGCRANARRQRASQLPDGRHRGTVRRLQAVGATAASTANGASRSSSRPRPSSVTRRLSNTTGVIPSGARDLC